LARLFLRPKVAASARKASLASWREQHLSSAAKLYEHILARTPEVRRESARKAAQAGWAEAHPQAA